MDWSMHTREPVTGKTVAAAFAFDRSKNGETDKAVLGQIDAAVLAVSALLGSSLGHVSMYGSTTTTEEGVTSRITLGVDFVAARPVSVAPGPSPKA